jgi:hypothetical protein
MAKKPFRKILASTKQKLFNKKIYGFDIETNNNNKNFVLASIYSDDFQKHYYSKDELINDLRTNKIFRNAVICATNLSFDFFGTFFNQEDSKNFFTLFRGSDLLMAKTYFYKDDFHREAKVKTKSLKSLLFLDSLNFAKLSVEKMGAILKIPKLQKPACLGKDMLSQQDYKELEIYNLRDSEITYKFMKFLISTFEEIGATFKNTLASTSMSLFKNKYLGDARYFQPPVAVLLEQFESYYGGRTEAFKRGEFHNKNYYDFNSLYPAVMLQEFPNPNSLRITYKNTNHYINKYHGISKIDAFVFQNTPYPILPTRLENGRVIFPTGNLTGWYTHPEIREAVKHGMVIKKVHKTHYYKEVCFPFKNFVTDLYELRNKFKEEKNIMEYVVKITMNSLYGKFGQRFMDKDNWIHESYFKLENLKLGDTFERKGNYIRLNKEFSPPANFCIPIWASYVASYGRIKLHRAIILTDPIYCDTDSLITDKELPTSNKLGDLKLELRIKTGVVVRPKFYALMDDKDHEHVKIKGMGRRLNYLEFLGLCSPLLTDKTIHYNKFAKFKEALRRDLIPNEIIATHKEFSLDDEKRNWENKFSLNFENSIPVNIK